MSDPSTPPPAYAPPVGYVAPAGFPAPSVSPGTVSPGTVSPGAASPGAPSPASRPFTQPAPPRSSKLGVIALCASLAATVLTPILAIVAGVSIGASLGGQGLFLGDWTGGDLSVLSPVREWVLLGEIAFWAGTLLGIWAIVQGIVAIVLRAGRVQGIVAIVLAAVGPVVFGIAVQLALTLGYSV